MTMVSPDDEEVNFSNFFQNFVNKKLFLEFV